MISCFASAETVLFFTHLRYFRFVRARLVKGKVQVNGLTGGSRGQFGHASHTVCQWELSPSRQRRDDGSPRFWRQTVKVEGKTDVIVKNPEFYSVGGARSKNSIFRVFRVPFDYPAHNLQKTVLSQPMVSMESRDSEDVPFASLESF